MPTCHTAEIIFRCWRGEHILATGIFLPPNADISFEHAVISKKVRAKPLPSARPRRITQTAECANKPAQQVLKVLWISYRLSGTDHFKSSFQWKGNPLCSWCHSVWVNPPNLAGKRFVRATGVYNPKLGPGGCQRFTLEIMVPDLNSLTILSRLSEDPRFKQSIEPIANLSGRSRTDLVRIVGQVKAQEPGRYLRLRDSSGQVDVVTGQTRPCAINELIEAVGSSGNQRDRLEIGRWPLSRGRIRSSTDGTATDGR